MRLSWAVGVTAVHIAIGSLAIALTGGAGVYGAWCWWRARASVWFWRMLRAGQGVIVADVLLGGVLILIGRKPPGLHVIYGLLPVAVSFLGEQLRVASAQMVLDARGFASAQEVGELAPDAQQAIVRAIVQRELGVMTLAAIVMVVLLARAAGTG
jgi:hypothetical protein